MDENIGTGYNDFKLIPSKSHIKARYVEEMIDARNPMNAPRFFLLRMTPFWSVITRGNWLHFGNYAFFNTFCREKLDNQRYICLVYSAYCLIII